MVAISGQGRHVLDSILHSPPPMSMSFTWDEGFDILELAGHLHPYDIWLESPACWERER